MVARAADARAADRRRAARLREFVTVCAIPVSAVLSREWGRIEFQFTCRRPTPSSHLQSSVVILAGQT